MKNMFKYIFPIWLAMTVNTLLGITDMYFVNQINSDYITAIGIAGTPFAVLSTLFVGIGIEANRSTASGKKINWKVIIITILITSFAVSGVSFLFSKNIFFYANKNKLYYLVLEYFNIYVFSLVPSAILYLCTGIFRGKGESEKTLWFSCEAVILNFILDFIFIKYNIFNSALKGCAFASVLSDTFTSFTYVIYIAFRRTENLVPHNKFNIKTVLSFFRNSFSYSLEKLFSTSTLTILSSIYFALLSIQESKVYYGLEKMYSPVLMLAYSYFEWVIYVRAKQIDNNRKQNYLLFFCFCVAEGIISILYLNLSMKYSLFCFLYACYHFSFFIEREYIAILFEKGKSSVVNHTMFMKSILLICLLQIEMLISVLNIFSIIITQLLLFFVCILILAYNDKKVPNNGKR